MKIVYNLSWNCINRTAAGGIADTIGIGNKKSISNNI